jgi:hypothetical protein
MTIGDRTQGHRVIVENNDNFLFQPGDYGKLPSSGIWWIRPPRGSMGSIEEHIVVEHEDGTITVSPSILLPGIWHGYLEHGIWREV